jgi:hypothetical protein
VNTLAKGNAWRRKVEVWLQRAGAITTVRGIGFAGDDITARLNDVVFSVEAKNTAAVTLAAWVAQARGNAHGSHPIVVAHRKGKADVDDAYVIMTGADFAALLADLTKERRDG